MADDDEIDVLGDFSFDSCLGQNNQGIPSCSDQNTVHPQWLLDATANDWYEEKHLRDPDRSKKGTSRIMKGNRMASTSEGTENIWTREERQLLVKEMETYGRDIRRISQTITTKTAAEIQALIDVEYGVNLDTPTFGLDKTLELEDTPSVAREEVITDVPHISNVLDMVQTGQPTVKTKKYEKKKTSQINLKTKSLLKPKVLKELKKTSDSLTLHPSEIFYEDDLVIGSTESVGSLELDALDAVSRKLAAQKSKGKVDKKIGNHRRKYSRNYEKTSPKQRTPNKDVLKSPRRRKDSSLSEETKSPKLQIVLGSGMALSLSEGEQIIKLEKRKDSEPESDIEVDIDSDTSDSSKVHKPAAKTEGPSETAVEEPIAVPLGKYERIPRRQKKLVLNGDGGYTITHTARGDVCAAHSEPRKERVARPRPVELVQCRYYSAEKPAPCEVRLHVSVLICMDVQAHTSRAEVMGLVGGEVMTRGELAVMEGGEVMSDGGESDVLCVTAYCAAAAASSRTHCDMEPVSQAAAAATLQGLGLRALGWHHSHPAFPAAPSRQDLRSQGALQAALDAPRAPFLALITSQHWPSPAPRRASTYRCIRVETLSDGTEVGYQLSVKLVPDITTDNLPSVVRDIREAAAAATGEDRVNMLVDVCEQAGITYLEKCISSVSHHMRSAGYTDTDPIVTQLLHSIRDIFR